MRWLAVLGLELRGTMRSMVPATPVRRLLLALAGLLAVLFLAVALFIPLRAGRTPPPVGAMLGFLVVTLTVTTSIALGTATQSLRSPETLRLGLLAPRPAAWFIGLRAGTASVPVLATIGFFYLPLLVVTFRLSPATAGWMALLAAALLLWSVTAAFGILALLAASLGRDRGAQVASLLSWTLGVLVLAGSRFVLRTQVDSAWVLGFLVLTAALGPPVAVAVARAYARQLLRPEADASAPEPRWGSPSHWRTLVRSPLAWAVPGSLPGLFLLVRSGTVLVHGAVALLLLAMSLAPLAYLMAPEHARPERWKLAPRSGRMRMGMLVRVGFPVTVVATAVAAAYAPQSPAWVGAVASIVALGQLSLMIAPRALRGLAQLFLFAATLATHVLR